MTEINPHEGSDPDRLRADARNRRSAGSDETHTQLSESGSNSHVSETRLSRREMTLMGIGLAVLCCGAAADSALNGYGSTDSDALKAAVARLDKIPAVIGNWTSTDSEISEREQEVAGIAGYIRRTYTNQRTGYEVHLTVLCGPSGPIAVHPPTACFEGIGYTVAAGPTPTTLQSNDGENAGEFNKSSFRQSDASVPEVVRVFWGWSTDGNWQAPANPRIEFRGQPWLYKIYATDRWLEEPSDDALPQIEVFLREALPVVREAVAESVNS